MKKASPLSIWAAMLAIYIIWGSTYLAIRFAVGTLPPFLMGACRYLVAGGLLYAWRRSQGDPAPSRREWRGAGIAGLFLLTMGNGGVAWAEQTVPSGLTALLIGTTPLWFVLIDWLRPGGAWPGWLAIIGVLVGFGGIVLLIGPGQVGGPQVSLLGAGAVLFATIAWATGSLYGRSAIFPASPLMGTALEMLVGGAGLAIVGTIAGDWGRLDLARVAPASLLSLAYLIVFGSLVAFSAYVWLLRVAPTPLVATYAYINPVVAIILGNLIAAEPLGPRTVVAAAIILGSVIVTNLARRAMRPRPAALTGGGSASPPGSNRDR